MGFAITGPDSIILNQGESTPAILQIVKAAKPWRNVGLTVSGLPNGVTAEFFPSNGKPSFNSTMTLRSAANSVTGTFTIIVTARDARSSQSMPIIFSNYQPPSVPSPTPAPVLTSLSPSNITEDTGAFTLTVNGSNFLNSAQVKWNGSNRTTTFISSTMVTAAILAGDITTPGTAGITTTNPGSGSSNSLTFTINAVGEQLVAHWQFNENTGTSAADATGNGHTGTITGGAWASGIAGSAVYFNGTSTIVTTPDVADLDITGAFTVLAWVKPEVAITDFSTILVKDYVYFLYAGSSGYCGTGALLGGFLDGSIKSVCNATPLTVNIWSHVGLTYNGANTLKLFLNGVEIQSSTMTGNPPASTGSLMIGGSPYGEYFRGWMDEVRLYSGALSASAIDAIYDANAPTAGPVLTSLTPNNIDEDSGAFTLQVNGTGFVSGATVFWNGSSRTTSFVSSIRVDASVLAGDITTAGTASITATNPTTVSSNALTFTINSTGTLNGLGTPIGYAAGVTGGYGGTNSVVTTLADSGAGSLRSFCEDATTRWITFSVNGTITLLSAMIVQSNKTIDGRGANISIAGQGTYLGYAGGTGPVCQNIILHNIKFSATSSAASRLTVGRNAHDVWIDHVSIFLNTVDIEGLHYGTDGSNSQAPYNLTVSWCRFEESASPSHGAWLSCADPSYTADAAGTCTMHHNWFKEIHVRVPYMRHQTFHSFNNWQDRGDIGVQVSINGSFLSENDVYEEPSAGAYARVIGLQNHPSAGDFPTSVKVVNPWLVTGGEDISEYNTGGIFTPPYSYTLETANAALVTAIEAGAGWH